MSLLRVLGYRCWRRSSSRADWTPSATPQRVAGLAEPVVRPVTSRLSALPDRTEDSVRLNGAVQLVAGLLLATGRMSRPAALAIAATLVPTTLAAHRFWEEEDDGDKAQHRIHFLKNLGLLGGLLIAADDTGGPLGAVVELSTPPTTCAARPTSPGAPSRQAPAPAAWRPDAPASSCPTDRGRLLSRDPVPQTPCEQPHSRGQVPRGYALLTPESLRVASAPERTRGPFCHDGARPIRRREPPRSAA